MGLNKQIHIIAGPNGAGKTSNARVVLLPDFLQSNELVNADEIAKILSPEDIKKSEIDAARLMLKRLEFLLKEGYSFAFETTLAAKTYLRFIRKAKMLGYKINLIFLTLANPQLAKMRVENRVKGGGHDIETDVIYRRFIRGLKNLEKYLEVVDTAIIYDASEFEFVEIAKKSGPDFVILNQDLWDKVRYGQ